MRPLQTFGIAALLLASAAFVAFAQDQTAIEWLRANAAPLATVEAGHGFADLQPLKQMIGDARIVSLGEATHGSREIFQLKHRLVEFLASELGFSVLAMEVDMPAAAIMNSALAIDGQDLRRPLSLFSVWNTDEVLDMFKWMNTVKRSGHQLAIAGFDMQRPEWALNVVREFCNRYDPSLAPTLNLQTENGFAVARATLPVTAVAGKRIRFSGYIKTEGVTRGYAGLWWRVDGPSRPLALDNMENRGATGTTEWKRYSIEMIVAPNAQAIWFGALFPGNGTAWFDDFTVEIDGQPFDPRGIFDFGFNSVPPRGFSTNGPGYTIALDASQVHSGNGSLRMKADGDTPTSWPNVIERLDRNRADYRSRGATDADIDWAIQNARLVVQNAGLASARSARDHAMADNVRWLAEQHPDAKIVIWAHNEHVAVGGAGLGPETMGADLRQAFGTNMVVIGTAFGEGGFRAQPMPGQPGAPRAVTVPPAPAVSLDGTLSAAKLPLFAIDLRHAPAWFSEPHAAREIGCCYPDNQPFALMGDVTASKAFDVLVFIDKVTAARPTQ